MTNEFLVFVFISFILPVNTRFPSQREINCLLREYLSVRFPHPVSTSGQHGEAMAHHPTCAKEIYFPGEGSCSQATGILHVSWHTHSEREEGREREKGKEREFMSTPECYGIFFRCWKESMPFSPRMRAFDSWRDKKAFITLSMGADDYIKLSIHWNGNAFPTRKHVSHW